MALAVGVGQRLRQLQNCEVMSVVVLGCVGVCGLAFAVSMEALTPVKVLVVSIVLVDGCVGSVGGGGGCYAIATSGC